MVQAVENHVYAFPNTEGAKVNFKERYDNFIPYYLKYGQAFITALKENLDSVDQQFTILSEE